MHGASSLKVLADVLTLSRGFVAIVLLRACSFPDPAKVVRFVVLLTLLGWTTDVCDGNLARASGRTGGRIASADLPMDVLMMWSAGYVFARAGIIPGALFFAYSVGMALAALLSRFNRAVVLGFCAPLSALPLVMSYVYAPSCFFMFVLWIAVVLITDWNRFTQVVDSFIDALPDPERRVIRNVLGRLGFHNTGVSR
ncbi:MAG: hypothetical protein NUW12_06150 [Firmicutes bacterium]|nr:hypothetical protein [Bacillota bacterium]MDH7495731.1 hypothetical protein [Bacillota bacterium]